MKSHKEIFNFLVEQDTDLKLLIPFIEEGRWTKGKVLLTLFDVSLEFDVQIPSIYPLTRPNSDNISIKFYNTEFIGHPHVNNDGSICFHPEKDDNLERKFKSELLALKDWMRKYYILDLEDEQYNYVIHDHDISCLDYLYFSNTNVIYNPGDFGEFNYVNYGETNHLKINDKTSIPIRKYFRLRMGEVIEDWSSQFIEDINLNNVKNGLWYFIDGEPLELESGNLRKGAKTWDQLNRFLSDSFLRLLHDGIKKKFNSNYFIDGVMFLIIGYKIPNDDSYEIHWDLIRIEKKIIPIESLRLTDDAGKKYYSGKLLTDKIKWGFTKNASYDRFFGRGKLTTKLSDSNILLVGCGALGSFLAELLIRGGVKFIVLEDFDDVESGNLCRANYELGDMNLTKVNTLKKRLKSISPFIKVNEIHTKLNSAKPEELKQLLNENIDVIFDCSTDPELTHILDKIHYQGIVYSLGITNKAKALACISGKNLSVQAMHFFEYLENSPADFYEGTGCGYPTFEANYNDVITLLSTALKKIENTLINKGIPKSFTISIKEEPTLQTRISEYRKYKYLDKELYISEELLALINIEVKKHYPKEFGGIFLGWRNGEVLIVDDILIPDKYVNGRSIFVRQPGSLNQRLKDVYEKSNGKIEYIGEWHSHPDQSATPSLTDKSAMQDIAKERMIKIDDPILLIAEIGVDKFEPNLFRLDKNKLNNYEREY